MKGDWIFMDIDLVDALEHVDYVSIQVGISSSHLTVIFFQRGRYTTKQISISSEISESFSSSGSKLKMSADVL